MKNRRNVLTNAGGGGPLLTGTIDESVAERLPQLNPSKNLAFTMAEILLSLTIIGVVAAITLPSLTGNINERTWNTQRKALYARFSQAIALMPSLNGYGTLTEDESGSVTEDTAAETFVTNGLAKVLKINNICDSEHLTDCGFASSLTTLAASKIEMPKTIGDLNEDNIVISDWSGREFSAINTKVAAFETANGESIAVYYNPRCTTLLSEPNDIYTQRKMCANFVYDLNGSKGPNTIGKDMGFLTAFYPTDSNVVAPYPYQKDVDSNTSGNVASVCKNLDQDYRMPSKEELASLFVNRNLVGNLQENRYWSSSLNASIDDAWYLHMSLGVLYHDYAHATDFKVRCVKR